MSEHAVLQFHHSGLWEEENVTSWEIIRWERRSGAGFEWSICQLHSKNDTHISASASCSSQTWNHAETWASPRTQTCPVTMFWRGPPRSQRQMWVTTDANRHITSLPSGILTRKASRSQPELIFDKTCQSEDVVKYDPERPRPRLSETPRVLHRIFCIHFSVSSFK